MTRYHIPRSRDPIEKQCADANSQLSKQTLGERSRQGLSLALLAFRGLIWRKGGEPIWASAPPTQICQSMPLREDVRATPRLRVQTSSLLTPSVIILPAKCKDLQKLGVCKKTHNDGRFRRCGRGGVGTTAVVGEGQQQFVQTCPHGRFSLLFASQWRSLFYGFFICFIKLIPR